MAFARPVPAFQRLECLNLESSAWGAGLRRTRVSLYYPFEEAVPKPLHPAAQPIPRLFSLVVQWPRCSVAVTVNGLKSPPAIFGNPHWWKLEFGPTTMDRTALGNRLLRFCREDSGGSNLSVLSVPGQRSEGRLFAPRNLRPQPSRYRTVHRQLPAHTRFFVAQ